jgi:hypothetical protein
MVLGAVFLTGWSRKLEEKDKTVTDKQRLFSIQKLEVQ